MADENSPANEIINTKEIHIDSSSGRPRTVTISVARAVKSNAENITTIQAEVKPKVETASQQRIRLYSEQLAAQTTFSKQVFPIEKLRSQFIELKRFKVAESLDKRGIAEMDALYVGFDHLYLVDDLIKQIKADLPIHKDYGWVARSGNKNHLNLPVAEGAKQAKTALKNHESIMAYAVTQFGVASFSVDKAIYIGNIAGYLLISYYFAHLKIGYSVTPLNQNYIEDYNYLSPNVVSNTRHVQNLSMVTKQKIYQLAVLCAKVSLFSVNKAIEKMLIADVNDFDKKKAQEALENLLRYGGS